jgi:nucleoside-diphosphate-sugar epimerase
MKVFVTGGSGFVGGHVIEALRAGHEVRAMARSEASVRAVEALGATAVGSSLDHVEAEHLAGCDAVVHAAAYVEDWGPEAAYERANVEGTRRILAAARAAEVRRFVHVSTNATMFDGTAMLGVDESRPYPARSPFPYARTKVAAERLVLDSDAPGFSTVALRPCFVWGPRDNTVLPTLRRVVAQGGFAWLDGGSARISTTHVANLVAGIALALASRSTGAYFVADEDDISVKEFFSGLAAAANLRLPNRSIPGVVARTAATALDLAWRGLGRTTPPPLTPLAAELSSRDMTVRTAKIRAELGWRPVVGRAEGLAALRE